MNEENQYYRTTLASVAKHAGVSKATASRVLNNVGTATTQTRDRILSAARKLNYVPNAKFKQLSRLKTGEKLRTGNIGLVLGSESVKGFSTHPYYGRLFWGIEAAASKQDYHLVLSTQNGDYINSALALVYENKVDGILIADTTEHDLLPRIQPHLPVVLVNTISENGNVSSVMPDEAAGVTKALAYLQSLGHSRITFFYIADSSIPNVHHALREKAFREHIVRGTLDSELARVVVRPDREQSLETTLYAQLREWQAKNEMPTAIVCAADTYALAFMDAANRLGLSVPEDLSIIGTDDTVPCRFVRPGLTSIRQPLEDMGAAGVKLLLERIEDEKSAGAKVTQLFDVDLMVRESCGPAK